MNAQQLKNSVLQMAVQGKLVPQDPNAEPAKALLEKIKAEKAELVKQKKIKADKNPSHIFRGEDNLFYETVGTETKCIQDEIPFDIPDSWEWVRLGEIFFVTKLAGFEYTKYFKKENISDKNAIPIVRAQNLKMGIFKENKTEAISYELSEKLARSALIEKCLLMTFIGAGIGEVCIFPGLKRNHLAPNVAKLEPFKNKMLEEYILITLMSSTGQQEIEKIKKSTAQSSLSMQTIREILIPIPPLEEQKRIAEKVQSLQPLIAQYAEADTALQNLEKSFPENLKKSLLQWAVQGKLVPQDPNDEPAKALLEKIKTEKAELAQKGLNGQKKIKADKNPSHIFRGENNLFYETVGIETKCIQDEIPFDIPDSWEWVRLEEICEYIQRGKSPKYSLIQKYPVIAQKCNQWTGFSIEKAQFIEPESIKYYSEERIIQDKDLLWNSTGLGTLGRIAIYYSKLNPYELAVADSHVTVIRPIKKFVLPEYCYSYFANPTVQNAIIGQSDGSTKQKELATSTVKSYLFLLPPLEEQKRITKNWMTSKNSIRHYQQ